MGKCYRCAVINAPVDEVWKAIRNFHDLSWASAIVTKLAAAGSLKGDQIGAKRVINDAFHETLLSLDDCKHNFVYSVDNGPGPLADGSVSNYLVAWRVLPITESNASMIEVQASFDSPDPLAVSDFLNPIYQALLGALKQRFSMVRAPGKGRLPAEEFTEGKQVETGKCYKSAGINAPVDEVWKAIRNFHDLSWASAIVTKLAVVGSLKGDQIGAKRVINDAFHETLLSLDDGKHKLSYSIDEAPGPMANGAVSNYIGTWRVLPITENNTALAEFQSSFDSSNAAAVSDFLNPIYQALLGALKQRFS